MDLGDIVKKAAEEVRATPARDLKALAVEAAKASDEAREVNLKAGLLKKELFEAMQAGGITKIDMPDRDPIKIKARKRAQRTLGALKEALGDDGEATRIWGLFPQMTSEELEIPKPNEEPCV